MMRHPSASIIHSQLFEVVQFAIGVSASLESSIAVVGTDEVDSAEEADSESFPVFSWACAFSENDRGQREKANTKVSDKRSIPFAGWVRDAIDGILPTMSDRQNNSQEVI